MQSVHALAPDQGSKAGGQQVWDSELEGGGNPSRGLDSDCPAVHDLCIFEMLRKLAGNPAFIGREGSTSVLGAVKDELQTTLPHKHPKSTQQEVSTGASWGLEERGPVPLSSHLLGPSQSECFSHLHTQGSCSRSPSGK